MMVVGVVRKDLLADFEREMLNASTLRKRSWQPVAQRD
jgi:hypothetical protein